MIFKEWLNEDLSRRGFLGGIASIGLASNLNADTPHFKQSEFACKHCGQSKVNKNLLTALEKLREASGNRPIKVISGYRCPEHNKKVGGAESSQHMAGTAADISISGMSPQEAYKIAKSLNIFNGIGIYPAHIHVDVRPGNPVSWKGSYKENINEQFIEGGPLAKLGGKRGQFGDVTVDIIQGDNPRTAFITGLIGNNVMLQINNIANAIKAEGYSDVEYRPDNEDGRAEARIRLFNMLKRKINY